MIVLFGTAVEFFGENEAEEGITGPGPGTVSFFFILVTEETEEEEGGGVPGGGGGVPTTSAIIASAFWRRRAINLANCGSMINF